MNNSIPVYMTNKLKVISTISINSTTVLIPFICFTFFTILPSSSNSQVTWTGFVNADWNIPLNWSINGVPTINDDVVIPDVSTSNPKINSSGSGFAKSIHIEDGGQLTLRPSATLTVDGSSLDGIDNEGTVINEGRINIGQVLGIDDHGIFNHGNGVFYNDGGEIYIDNMGAFGVGFRNSSVAENKNNGQILIGQNDGNLLDDGIYNIGTFINNNATILIDNVAFNGIYNVDYFGLFENKNNGQILIGQNGGNIGEHGIRCYNSGTFYNDNSLLKIDATTLRGIYNHQHTTFENRNNGVIYIGELGNLGDVSIRNGNNSTFINQACSHLHVFSDNEIIGNANFVNNGVITEEASGASNITTNSGVVQNFNGGSFTITTNNGSVTTAAGTIWTGCVDNNWKTAANWHTLEEPTAADQVLIFASPTFPLLNSGASIKSLLLGSGAQLFIFPNGLLAINDSPGDGIINQGFVSNQGIIEIGKLAPIRQDGIDNRGGSFVNQQTGLIKIDTTRNNGIHHFNGSFINSGNIIIGSTGIGDAGINNNKSFINNAAGTITIDNAHTYGIFNEADTLFNHGNIIIGGNAPLFSDAFVNGSNATFYNLSMGNLTIKNTDHFSINGIENSGDFINLAIIGIGGTNSISGIGILNQGNFKHWGGVIQINNTFTDGIFNETGGNFSNKADLKIGNVSRVDRFGINNNATFLNETGGTIDIQRTVKDGIFNLGNFTNEANIIIGGATQIKKNGIDNSASFINDVGGDIDIPKTKENGINNSGDFSNYASITIGKSNNLISEAGIFNSGTFNNLAISLNRGSIDINNTLLDGITNEASGVFNNWTDITIGNQVKVEGHGISNLATFNNEDGSIIDIEQTEENGLYNTTGGLFTNKGSATLFSEEDIVNEGATLNNDGTIYAYANINNSSSGILMGNGEHTLEGAWINEATFQAGTSTVVLTGSGNAYIQETAAAPFYNLQIKKTGNAATLATNIEVDNTIILTLGQLDLKNFDLTLGTASGKIDGEVGLNHILGSTGGEIIKEVDLNAPNNNNPGNIGVNISSTANLGITTIKRGHLVQNVNGELGVDRYYEITPSNNAGLDATVRFSYLDHELNGIAESDLAPFRNNGVDWQEFLVSNNNTASKWVETTNVDAFSVWTLAEQVATFPVELLSFTARPIDNKSVLLEWETASELNNDFFEIECSRDGIRFFSIAVIAGNGNSNVIQNYQSWDNNPSPGTNYYRLRQIDFDGTLTYSDIKVVEITSIKSQISVFPNPTNGALNFNEPLTGRLVIRNIFGQNLWQINQAEAIQNLDLSFLAAGTYLLEHLDQQKNLSIAKFIVSK